MRKPVPATIRTVVILGVVDIELKMKSPCVDLTRGLVLMDDLAHCVPLTIF
jgi:hypothetical protein